MGYMDNGKMAMERPTRKIHKRKIQNHKNNKTPQSLESIKKPEVPIETLRWAFQRQKMVKEEYRKFFEKYFKEKNGD